MSHTWLLHWHGPTEKLLATPSPSVEDTSIQSHVLHLLLEEDGAQDSPVFFYNSTLFLD